MNHNLYLQIQEIKLHVWQKNLMAAILLYKNYIIQNNDTMIKGIVHPKMKILPVITHPHVVPNP